MTPTVRDDCRKPQTFHRISQTETIIGSTAPLLHRETDLDRYIMVVLGGGLGSLTRYMVGTAINVRIGGRFPLGTMVINITGSFFIGVLMTLLTERLQLHPNWRLEKHFRGKIRDAVFKNLSRLAFQWEEIVNAGLAQMEKEALLRMDNLIATIEHLLRSAPQQVSAIQEHLADLDRAQLSLRP